MNYRYLTGTGIKISELTLGTMCLGSHQTEKEAIRLVLEACDKGIISFDMAESYEFSEIIMGRAIHEMERSSIILISKVFGTPSSKNINACGLSSKHIRHSVEKSLRKLGTEYIDIYFLHGMDPVTPIEETLITMDNLVREGKICYYGLSNFTAWQTVEVLWNCDKLRLIKPIASQCLYNLLTRDVEKELLPCIEKYSLGLFGYNILAGGLLTGKYSLGLPENSRFARNQRYRERYWNEKNIQAVHRLSEISEEIGITLYELALRWILNHEVLCSAIIGVSSVEQLDQLTKTHLYEGVPESVSIACDEVWTYLSGERQFYGRYFKR